MTRRALFGLTFLTTLTLTNVSFGQGTYTWNASNSGGTGGSGTAWLRNQGLGAGAGENWTGGTAGTFPGLDNSTATINDGSGTDVAVYAITGNLTSVIGMSGSTANNGVTGNGAANGRLQVGGVANTSAGGFSLTLNASSSSPTPPGILQLNGAFAGNTAGLAANTVLSATGGNITITRGTTNLLDVELGVNAIMTAAASRTISITSNVGQSGGTRTLTKDGAGTLTLSGINTYSGATTINGGTLNANTVTNGSDSATGTGAITINTGGNLAGTGSALGAVTINEGGRLIAGTGAVNQTLTVASTAFGSGSIFRAQVTGTGGQADNGLAGASRLAITGAFDVQPTYTPANPSVFELSGDGATFIPGQQYTRTVATFGNMGPVISFAFGANLTIDPNEGINLVGVNGLQIDPANWQIGINEAANPGVIIVRFTPVPEPTTILGIAAIGALAIRRVRRRK